MASNTGRFPTNLKTPRDDGLCRSRTSLAVVVTDLRLTSLSSVDPISITQAAATIPSAAGPPPVPAQASADTTAISTGGSRSARRRCGSCPLMGSVTTNPFIPVFTPSANHLVLEVPAGSQSSQAVEPYFVPTVHEHPCTRQLTACTSGRSRCMQCHQHMPGNSAYFCCHWDCRFTICSSCFLADATRNAVSASPSSHARTSQPCLHPSQLQLTVQFQHWLNSRKRSTWPHTICRVSRISL